jgi:hypothetical protein
MHKIQNKTMAIIFAILMVTSSATAIAMLPTASAHDPAWTFPSYSYVVPAPDPIGVGQTGAIVMWVDYPLPGANVVNDIRRHDYTLTITKPDGTTETQHWDRKTADYDTTGTSSILLTKSDIHAQIDTADKPTRGQAVNQANGLGTSTHPNKTIT